MIITTLGGATTSPPRRGEREDERRVLTLPAIRRAMLPPSASRSIFGVYTIEADESTFELIVVFIAGLSVTFMCVPLPRQHARCADILPRAVWDRRHATLRLGARWRPTLTYAPVTMSARFAI